MTKPKSVKQGKLDMPPVQQRMTGFDGKHTKATLSKSMQECVDFLLDKREQLENIKNAVEDAGLKVESEMRAEDITTITALDSHDRPFTITLKIGRTKLEVKAVK